MPSEKQFDPSELTRAASDVLSVRRVFGEAYEKDGTLVIPVAKVMGATGTGSGEGEGEVPGGQDHGSGSGNGGGGGFGMRVKALGVYVVDEGGVSWRPALDLNRVILGGQLVGAVAISGLCLAWAVSSLRR